MDIKVEREAQNIIQPGSIVEWLKAKGTWIVQATTGIVAKIRDTYGKEVLVNCQELNKHHKQMLKTALAPVQLNLDPAE